MDQARPVPAPRRLQPELRPSNYENIQIGRSVNHNNNNNIENESNRSSCKKLNINVENLHRSCAEKQPPNRQDKLILPNQLEDREREREQDQEQPIYGPDANENVTGEPLYATPRPAPRQRAPPNEASLPSQSQTTLRAAPQVPLKPLNIEPERSRQLRQQRSISLSSEFSTTSTGIGNGNGREEQLVEQSDQSRYASNASLNCSESSQSGIRFKSPSPGYVEMAEHSEGEATAASTSTSTASDLSEHDDNNLLRSLGSTSKLLGESIGERVASKAKGAKKRLDKNLKSSTEAFSNLSADATSRLRQASKRLGNNFSLGRRQDDKEAEAEAETEADMLDLERRQTVPNTDVFNTIQFSSPLRRNLAGGGASDLSQEPDDGSYEVPRRSPPTYDEALKTAPSPKQQKEKQPPLAKNLALEAKELLQQRQQLRQSSCSDSSSELPSPPMPAFPPPALPASLDAAQPPTPVRLKRRKQLEMEEIELRRSSSSQLRLARQVESAELQQLNRAAAAKEREESMLMRAKLEAAEASMPKPERSDSWQFYGEEEDDDDREDSSPEPLYANNEATYGKVFEMATVGSNVMAPESLACISEEHGELEDCVEGAVGGCWLPPMPAPEIIQEFDPLSSKSSTLSRSNKSNELLLLEHLLEEDTYGRVAEQEQEQDDDISMCTSEEDGGAKLPPTVVLPLANATATATDEAAPSIRIVHQNAQLLSDSMENMLDEARVKPHLSRLEQKAPLTVDLAPASRNRSNWFVDGNGQPTKLNIEGDSPPTYLEAIGGDGKPTNKTTPPTNTTTPTATPTPTASATSTLTSRLRQTMSAFSNVKIRVDAMKRKASFKAANQRASEVKVALQMVPRPSLSPLLVRYEGPLIRFPSGVVEDILKEMQNRKAILRDRQFQTYLDQEMRTPKECIPLEAITTLQCVSNSRVTDNSTHFYCFELTTSVPRNGGASGGGGSGGGDQMSSNPNLVMTSSASGNCKQQRVAHLYGVGKESERGVWMQKILESLTKIVPVKYTCHYYRAGWCYLKNSITSEWSGTWLVLRKSQRRLIFVTESTGNVEKMDLRKARCIVLKESDESIDNLHVESGPMLMIDCPPFAIYMIMSSSRETKIWRHIIREVAHNNGFSLGDQQLTRYDVPVIVDKCINFVYIHGSMSEGIYRKSGSENSMHKLLTAFRADAFNVEITRNEYNEHDVANVLKRFMRDLPERLLGKLTDSFMFVTELTTPSEKIPIYKELLGRLSSVERETLRRIVGHLVFISSQQAKNKMSVQNLTMIWGPTLLAKKQDEMIYSQKEADVLTDLIVLYKNLFPISSDEVKREQAMLMCLQKYYAAAETLKDAVKQSGDIKIWISLNPNPDNTTEEKTQVNATISPTKSAYELCREYSTKMGLPTHQLTLYEVILNDSLERPLHHDTKVFDVILNWSYWPEEDRKHNYLVIRPVVMLREVQRAIKNLATITPGKELRFADSRTKAFKALQCELRDGKIVVSKKDKNDKTTIVREIFLHSSTAYLGCERKRDFPWSWAITFVERTQAKIMRSRDAPFIGHVLAGSEWVDRTIWYSSIWCCLFGDDILPPAEIIMK